MFANKNSIIDSALDGVGMGIGFTLALGCMGLIRELLGSGTVFDVAVFGDHFTPMSIFMLAPGGFFVFAVLVAASKLLRLRVKLIKKKQIWLCRLCYAMVTVNQLVRKGVANNERTYSNYDECYFSR